MPPKAKEDPLDMADFDPERLEQRIEEIKVEKAPKGKAVPSELEAKKEERLAMREKRLAGIPQAPEPPPPAPGPPPQYRSMLLDKIAAYRERFPNLKKRNNVTARSSLEEIEDELHYCEMQLGKGTDGLNIGATVLWGSMVAVERITHDYWNPLGLNLHGLGSVTKDNMSDFQPIIDELMIKHGAGMYTSPEWRLALTLGATVMTVNAANQNPEMARSMKQMNQPVSAPPGSEGM